MGGVLHPPADPVQAVEIGEEVGRLAAPFAADHDLEGSFVDEGYQAVRKLSYGSLPVPADLGGGGQGLEGMCRAQAAMARGCASTSLAIAMHTHAVLTMAWRRARGDSEVDAVLRRVATEGLVVAASGTLNPAMISVDLRPADGGYVATGRRRLASGAPGADVLVSAARLHSPAGTGVVTALVPLRGEGVTVIDDWDSLGMRGSGTNSVAFERVFVPKDNVLDAYRASRRPPSGPPADAAPAPQHDGGTSARAQHDGPAPRGGMHMPGLHISLPIIGAVYLGAADAVCDAAIRAVAGSGRADNPGAGHLTGLMVHERRMGWWALEGMIRDTTDESLGTSEQMVTTMLGKRQVVLSAIRAVEAAVELLGSSTYMRGHALERALRDVRAGITHPLPPEATLVEVGWETMDLAARAKD